MAKQKITKASCGGCRDDYYNHTDMGLNMKHGRPECWSLDSALPQKALDIPIDLRPPYLHIKPTTRPTCYKAKGYVRVTVDRLTKDGFWK